MEAGSLASGLQARVTFTETGQAVVWRVWGRESNLRHFKPGGGDGSPVSNKIELATSMLGRGRSKATSAGTIRAGCVEEPAGS